MSFLMNGKELWCRPARTKSFEGPREDQDELAAERLAILKNARQLVQEGVKAGLVKLADPSKFHCQLNNPNNILVSCVKCSRKFERSKKTRQTICYPCRLPAMTCKICKTVFQPNQKAQQCCSQECKNEATRIAGREREAKRPWLDCPICGGKYKLKFGMKSTLTCSKQCGIELMIRNQKATKAKNKHENQTQ